MIRPSGTPVEGVAHGHRLSRAGRRRSCVMLGFKPQKLDEVAPELAPQLSAQRRSLVSMLAGVEAASLARALPGRAGDRPGHAQPSGRAGAGVTALYQRRTTHAERADSSPACSRRSACAPGARPRKSLARSVRSPAPDRPMSRASSTRWPRRARARAATATCAEQIALADGARHGADGRDDAAKRWPRSPGASPAPTARPKPGLAVLDATACSSRWSIATIEAAARRGAELAEEAAARN